MGELSYGSSECYRFEHRLFEFLVKRMGFNAIAIEASTVACEPINDYVLHGKGALAEALTGEIYSLWHTEEMTALIKWMRSYNQGVPEARKVQFFGMDLGSNERARKQVRAYVEAHIPQWLAPLDSIFQPMAAADPKMPMRMNELKDQAAVLLPKLQAFFQYLHTHQEALTKRSSLQDFEKIKRYTRIMEQFLAFHIGYRLRSGFMGENLHYLVEQMPDAKFMVLAHKWHIAAVEESNNLGQQLRKNLGEKYYAFTFESYQGSFLGRTWNPDQKYLGEFKFFELGPDGENTLPWYLAEAQKRNFFLNMC